jgi:hypothetical protein
MGSKTITVADDIEFNALIQALARDVVDAHIYWDQHNALLVQLEKWPDVQTEAWPFWHYTLQAHRRTSLASLARVFDQEQAALHLRSWLTSIREHLHLFGKDAVMKRRAGDPFAPWMRADAAVPSTVVLDQDIKSCSKSDPDVTALFVYRHNVLAHRGAKLSKQGESAKLPELFVEQIERLLARAHDILNRYSYLFDASFFSMTPLGHDAVERVFEGMQRDLDQSKADIASQVVTVESKRLDFERQMQLLNGAAAGREGDVSELRKALAMRFGYTIDSVGQITGVVLWTKGEQAGR